MKQYVITYNHKYYNKEKDTFNSDLSLASIFNKYEEAFSFILTKGFTSTIIQEVKVETTVEDTQVPLSFFLDNMVNGKNGRIIYLKDVVTIPQCILKDKESNIFTLKHCQDIKSLLASISSSSKTTYILSNSYHLVHDLTMYADITIQDMGYSNYRVIKNRGTGHININLVDAEYE